MPQNVAPSDNGVHLFVFADNEAVIKMIKGKSPDMRHVSRTHRGDVDWSCDRVFFIRLFSLRYVTTEEQMADILTKGSFTISQCTDHIQLVNVKNNTSH